MNKLLLVLLGLSAGLNAYLLWFASPSIKPSAAQLHFAPSGFAPPQRLSATGQLTSSPPRPVPDDSQGLTQIAAPGSNQLNAVAQWLAAKQYDKAKVIIQNYLRQSPQDTAMLILEAQYIEATESVSAALHHYYHLLDYALTDDQNSHVLGRIESLSQQNIDTLSAMGAWDILAGFVEPLWQFEPTRRKYILALSLAYAQQRLQAPTENVLASLAADDVEVQRIRAILYDKKSTALPSEQDRQELVIAKQQYDKAVEMHTLGDHFVVNAYYKMQPLTLMIDTGASTTVLTERAFRQLDKNSSHFVGRYNIHTAGGTIEAPVYTLQSIEFAGEKLQSIAVVVLPMDNFHQASGLLGMNILKQFDFKIDPTTHTLWLSKQ